MPMAQIKAND